MSGSATGGLEPSPTEKLSFHVKPGHARAPFFRYFQFNLPKTTKVLLIVVIAAIGALAAMVANSGFTLFPHDTLPLWIITGAAIVYVLLGITTRLRIWDFGLLPALGSIICYIAGLFGDSAPYVWHGAPKPVAAGYTLWLMLSAGYLVLYWALNYGMIVAWPDDQNFHD